MCNPITTQSGVSKLILWTCVCVTVFFDSLTAKVIHQSQCQSEVRSCFGYEEAGIHAYSTYRDTQIHPDACFGARGDHIGWISAI